MSTELTGRRLGVYQLHERVGAGGMGEVYRARDTRLQRDVAVKILPEAFAADGTRRARFEREALVLASLNHPNIATIHGIEDEDGVHALVMELVDGETLADRIMRGAVPISEALAIARQIADALDAAHERGIVHRDLKPANIKLTSSGLVKVLDFGLAKAIAEDDVGSDASQVATATLRATQAGRVVGTPAYMSPEQMRGQPVDKRTDIWAFGCVLYEMVTGRPAFARQTMSDTIAAILEREPEWDVVRATAPVPVRALLKHCLAKDARRRLRDIADARIQIEEILAEAPAAPLMDVPRRRSYPLWGSLALGVLAVAAGVAAYLLATRSTLAPTPVQLTLSFTGQMNDVAITSVPSPSPDGGRFVFIGTNEKGARSLWIRAMESSETRMLAGTEGAQTPIWSPDGAWVAFFADGKLKKIAVSGGQPQTIAALPGFQDASWGSQGVIIFRPSNRLPLFRIADTGGEIAPLTRLNEALGENSHRGVTFLPDGRRFLFTSRCAEAANNTLYLGSLDSPEPQRVMSAQSKAIFLAGHDGTSSRLLYYRDGNLEARTFDPDRNALGDPRPLIGNVDYNSAGIGAFFQASSDGRVIVIRPAGAAGAQLTWFARTGEQIGTVGTADSDLYQPRLSPKGDRIAFTRADPKNGNRDVWIIELDRGIATPLTRNAANDWHPVWSADGTRLLFNSDRAGKSEGVLYVKSALDASSEETLLFNAQSSPTDWSRDGRWVVVGGTGTAKPDPDGSVAQIISIATSSVKRLLDAPSRNGAARFSPDGKWVAYTSEETGRFEVFVRPFANGVAAGAKIQISESGGDFPVWRPDGQELYFMSEDATIHAVATRGLRMGGPAPRPHALFRPCPGSAPQAPPMSANFWGNPYDTSDGNRFIVDCIVRPSREFVVLMNWPLAQNR
jgi:serine/threonine protein kinase/Tol biopolymer transport system component